MKSDSIKIQPEVQKTYFAVVKNSVGAGLFKNFYAKVGGKSKDIMANGELSCAFFVSSICRMFDLTKKVHGTVDNTLKDLEKFGWSRVRKPQPGDILIWEELKFGKNDCHKHIGFYLGDEKAISNSTNKKHPVLHHSTFGIKNGKPVRKIEVILNYDFKKSDKK